MKKMILLLTIFSNPIMAQSLQNVDSDWYAGYISGLEYIISKNMDRIKLDDCNIECENIKKHHQKKYIEGYITAYHYVLLLQADKDEE